jgi:serine/threonine-protein kinase
MTQGEVQADPLVGTTVANKYKIVKQLGEGGMGCVYLAEQQLGSTARKVALKTLHKHLSHDPHIKKRFDREVGTVAALHHPNTIQVFDFGTMEDGTLYLVMEFVEGRSVADILEKDGAMQPARVENILRQVCGSLGEAHTHGIVHRDLKPDNVVLCERAGEKDWVEVLDFGIAKRSSEHDPNEAKLTQQGMVLGTPPYMSPEQFTGQPVDLRSDIYALGVMTYEMLVGKYPFEANTAWEWASKHMTEPPRPIETQPLGDHVPLPMRNAISRALAKNKDERFASVKEFYDAFAGNSAQQQTSAMGAASAASAGGNAAAFAPSEPGGRAKTEMAQPVMGGGPPGAITPPYGPGPGSSPMGAPAPHGSPAASVPQGPMHTPAKKGGGSGLVIGLAVLAVLLLGGGVTAYALRGKPKPVSTTTLADLGGAASASAAPGDSATAAPPEGSATAAGTTDPLGGTTTAAAVTTAKSGAGTPTGAKTAPIPSPKPQTIPSPTPKPPAVDPPICAKARDAAGRKSPTAASLAAQCAAAGGKL